MRNPKFEIPPGTKTPTGAYQGKRILDVFGSLLLILLTLPLMLLTATLLWLVERRRLVRKVEVVGLKGKVFHLWLFDTQSLPRKRFFRRFNPRVHRVLVTLPQLFQVLSGSLSLVGPPPQIFKKAVFLDERLAAYRERLRLAPGLLSPDALAPPDCNEQTRLEFSRLYLVRASLKLDLWILSWSLHRASKDLLSPWLEKKVL